MRPNVILVVLDTARADAFEPYGAAPGASPVMAQLAGRGVALRTVIAPACWTVPSHAAMLTGLLPREVGLGQAPAQTPHSCRPRLEAHRDRLLPEVLRRAGYATSGLSANLWIQEASGFAIGFDDWLQLSERQAPELRRGRRAELQWAWYALRARDDDGAAQAEAEVRRRLRGPRRDPFFWFVNLTECHSPYLPPRRYTAGRPLTRARAGAEACRHLTLDSIWRASIGDFQVPSGALTRMRDLYARSIRQLDDWLGRLVSLLDEERVLDDTLLIVTADHGENFGEGGLMGHCFSLDQRLIHVPFVAAGPGAPADHGILSLTELPRIVVSAAGISTHPYGSGGGGTGVAVAQFDGLVPRDDPRAELMAQAWGLGAEAADLVGAWMTCATDGRAKLIRHAGADRLVDLAADPLELAPQALTAETRLDGSDLDRLRAALDAASAGEHPSRIPLDAVAVPDDERAHLERQMRMLGYL